MLRLFCLVLLSSCLILNGCVKGGDIDSLPVTLSLSSAAQSIDGGGKLTFTVDVGNDFGVDGVTWSLQGPGSLTAPETSLAAKYTTFYNAPATVTTTATATLTATSVADKTKSATATITVYPTVVLSPVPAGLPVKTGTAYTYTLPGSGGSGALSYAVTGGELPKGLLLSASGVITGTATTGGSYTVIVQVQDKPLNGNVLGTASQTYSITVS